MSSARLPLAAGAFTGDAAAGASSSSHGWVASATGAGAALATEAGFDATGAGAEPPSS